MRRRGAELARGRLALVGDSAGLVDPLSGDGIYEAFLSANLAARHGLEILAGRRESFGGYAAELERRLAPMMRAARAAKLPVDHAPVLAFHAARTPFLWNVVVRMMRGEASATRPAPGAGPGRGRPRRDGLRTNAGSLRR
jgi:flavin-dependent dehydrogenase